MRTYLVPTDIKILTASAFATAVLAGSASLCLSDDFKEAGVSALTYGIYIPTVLAFCLARQRRHEALEAEGKSVPVALPIKIGRAFAQAVHHRLHPETGTPRRRPLQNEHHPYPWQTPAAK